VKVEKMKRPGQRQILTVGLGLWVGLGLVAIYFLGWLAGIAVVSLGMGFAFIFIGALSEK
jgi:hypothetical protein